jgi:activator of HSP90 ATPase
MVRAALPAVAIIITGVDLMARTVILAASMPAPPDRLFDMYLDPELHAAFTGAPVTIGPSAGAPFVAFNGLLSGKMLHVEPKRLIVQAWRSVNWPTGAIDSTLVLSFWTEKDGARIELVHVNVPEEDFAGVSRGWEKYYWTPWRAYLMGESATQEG